MEDINRLEVKIQGRQYTIVASESAEYIYKICSYVNKKMASISIKNSRLSTDMSAVLTAINLADELHKAKSSEDNLRSQILKYDEEARKSENRVKELEKEIAALSKKLDDKEKELSEFIKQF